MMFKAYETTVSAVLRIRRPRLVAMILTVLMILASLSGSVLAGSATGPSYCPGC